MQFEIVLLKRSRTTFGLATVAGLLTRNPRALYVTEIRTSRLSKANVWVIYFAVIYVKPKFKWNCETPAVLKLRRSYDMSRPRDTVENSH